MDITQIAIVILTLASGALGWFARELYSATQALRKDLSALEVRIGTDYVRYDRMQDMFKPVMEALQEIKQALAQKADKL